VTQPALVVLDLDGTLVQLAVDWTRIRERLTTTLAGHGLRPANGVLATIAELDADRESGAAEACRSIVASAEIAAASRAMVNGTLLSWLQTAVPLARLAILTRNDRVAALTAVARLKFGTRLAPADVLGRDDATPKPSPDGLFRLMDRHGLSPRDCVIVGDSEIDRVCGELAGVRMIDVAAIGVDWVDAEVLASRSSS
jgi:phosphoglycolate phosphatase-like HAD superfamily hydrolase